MEITITISEDQIIQAINEWFTENLDNPRIWETKLGKVIKEKISARGNFKNKARGKPILNLSKEHKNRLEIKSYREPEKMTDFDWKTLHKNYLISQYNKIAEFKQNNRFCTDGKWHTNDNVPIGDWSKPGFTDIRIPPAEPIKDLEKYIEWIKKEIF